MLLQQRSISRRIPYLSRIVLSVFAPALSGKGTEQGPSLLRSCYSFKYSSFVIGRLLFKSSSIPHFGISETLPGECYPYLPCNNLLASPPTYDRGLCCLSSRLQIRVCESSVASSKPPIFSDQVPHHCEPHDSRQKP
ncbi:hypothetical protein F5Y12DRAFT_611585 [Xylaria sp. FL1777]|nr:hypothetical protein F5Y12DRAFT_611585 [Xylaria sp. FL1777]